MQHIEKGGGTWQLWALVDIDEKVQKMIRKTRVFDCFSIVKLKYLDQF